jgi:hypothetical protein
MGLRRRPWLVAALLAAVAVVASAPAAAGDGHRERERLTARDMSLASTVALRPADVSAAWRSTPVPAGSGDTRCAGFDPDFSHLTITGKARTAFANANGESIVSLVEVYASKRQAVEDYTLGAKPAVARCLRTTLERAVPAGGVTLRVRSSRMQPLAGVGDRSAAFRLVADVSAGSVAVPIYLDALVFQRGRTVTALLFTSVRTRLPGQLKLATTVAARMR